MYLCCWFSKPRVIRPQRHESIQLFVQEPSHCFVCDRLDIDTLPFILVITQFVRIALILCTIGKITSVLFARRN